MTSFIAWVGVDSRSVASINFASDSRISWDKKAIKHWDYSRKTFSCTNFPDIFGYVGEVLFPSTVLGQIVIAIDSGCLFKKDICAKNRFEIIVSHIKYVFENYPSSMKDSFSIFHAFRSGEGMQSNFHLNVISWTKNSKKWNEDEITIPSTSSVLKLDGSGARYIKKWGEHWSSSSQGGTSRVEFSAFCDAIYSNEDKQTCGVPQLVSLYRKHSGKTIGFVDNEGAYIAGMQILSLSQGEFENFEWRNRYFERCQSTGLLIKGTQKHHVPKGTRQHKNKNINNSTRKLCLSEASYTKLKTNYN